MDTRTRGAVRGRSTHPRFPDYRKPGVGYIKRERLIPVDKPQTTTAPMSKTSQPEPIKTFAKPSAHIEDAPKPLPTIPVYIDAPRPPVSPLQKNHAAGSFDMAPRRTHQNTTSTAYIHSQAASTDQNSMHLAAQSSERPTLVDEGAATEAHMSETPLQVPGFVFKMPANSDTHITEAVIPAFQQVNKKPSHVALFFNKIVSSNVQSLMKTRKFTRVHALYGMAIAIFIGGVGVSLQGFFVNQQVVDQVHAVAQSEDSSDERQAQRDVPSEKPLPGDPTRGYHVAALAPRVMTIPKLGVNARVLSLGVSAENEMLTPKNIYDTGWYNGSARPGEAGATVINGHVSGPTKQGVFHQIKTLVAGDELMIERGDGTKLIYHVKSVETLPESKVDMIKLLNAAVPGSSGLNLITCSGRYSSETNSYSDRTVVYAVLK